MNPIDRNQILKMLLILFAIIGAVSIATYFRQKSMVTLDQYAREQAGNSSGQENTDQTERQPGFRALMCPAQTSPAQMPQAVILRAPYRS